MDIRRNQLAGFAGWLGIAAVVTACGGQPPSIERRRQEDIRSLEPARAENPVKSAGPAATIDGKPVPLDEMSGLLEEAAGAVILRELALDRAVAEACKARGITIQDSDLDAERDRLLDMIERDAKAAPADAGVLLEKLRASRGLGQERFARLLRRNAGLRKLIDASVEVSSAEVEQALRVQHGQKFRVRVIVVATERQAAQIRRDLENESARLDVDFARRAFESSTDASAQRGGLLDPISPADQAYPESIRSLLTGLQPGVMSPVVAVDQGFAVVLLDSKVDGVAPPEGAEKDAQIQIRLRKQRLAMEDAARRLLAGMTVTPRSPGLVWSWQATSDSR